MPSYRVEAFTSLVREYARERKAFESLRYHVFSRINQYEPENAEGRERDAYDKISSYVLLFEDDKLVGGCRVIDGRETEVLPITVRGDITGALKKPSAEISRLCFVTKMESPQLAREVFYKGLYDHFLQQGLRYGYASIQPHLWKDLDTRFPNVCVRLREVQRKKGKKLRAYFAIEIPVAPWGEYYTRPTISEYRIQACKA